jgi:hypothetical protein
MNIYCSRDKEDLFNYCISITSSQDVYFYFNLKLQPILYFALNVFQPYTVSLLSMQT